MKEPHTSSENMTARTKTFALRVFRLCNHLHGNDEKITLGNQLFRSATSVAANYQATQYAPTTEEFQQKLKICEEEADEAHFWLNAIANAAIVNPERLTSFIDEAHPLAAIIAKSCKTLYNKKQPQSVKDIYRTVLNA